MKQIESVTAAGFVCLMLLGTAPAANAIEHGERQIEATGVSAITGSTLIARDQAIEDAKRVAVEQAVGALIGSQSFSKNRELIYDKILIRSSGYISAYDIISEGKGGDFYKVTISAMVSTGRIGEDTAAIGILMIRKNMPRVVVLIDEQCVGFGSIQPWIDLNMLQCETTVMKAFLSNGFNVVDAQTVRSNIARDANIKAAIEHDDAAARVIGKEYGADVVITGKAIGSSLGKVLDSAMSSASANITARAIDVDTGRILGVETANNKACDPDALTAAQIAMSKTGKEISQAIMQTILNTWVSDTDNSAPIQVLVTNVPSFKTLSDFKTVLRNKVRGVNDVFQRSFIGGSARLDIMFEGNATALAESLRRIPFSSFSLVVTSITANRVDLRLVRPHTTK